MAKQLNVNLAFTADTSKASKEIQNLQQQLTKLLNNSILNSNSLGLTKEIKEATTAVAQLKAQLSNATTSSGLLDLTKFNDSLKASGMSLEEYRIKLSSLGSDGTAAFSQLASSIASAEIPIKRANTLLTEMGTTLMNTARWQLSSSLLHGFIGGLKHAYGYAQDLNESLNNIRIVTGQSTDQMAQFAEKANKAAKELSIGTNEYAKSALIFYQQGLSDKEVEERNRTVAKLTNVTKQSAEEVSSQMTAIWNNFDNGTKSLEYYADAITALGAKTASSSAEIAQGLSKFAAVADTIGLSYETATAALATVVAETRQSADTVGTAFKTLFSRIQSLKLGETLEDGVGLTKYTAAIEAVGVKVLDMNGELREADDILSDLGQRWKEISNTQKTALAQTVAGQRQYAQFIALMENWDKVQENAKIAKGSEGTLQEQQEIYAESWEAAGKRVQAAAEEIYHALLDEDFFIKFDNFLASTLNGISKLIGALGGLPGLLTNIGALLTNVFSNQIAAQIDRIVYNIQMSTKTGRQQIQDRQQEAINLLQKQSDEISGDTHIGEAQKQALDSQASLQQTLLNNQKSYNAEQLKTAQILLDQNESLRNQAVEAGKIADITSKNADKEAARLMSKVNNLNVDPLEDKIGFEDAITNFRTITEQGQVLTSTFSTLKGVLDGTFDTPKEQIQVLQETFSTLEPSIQQTVDALKEFNPSQASGFQQLGDQLKNSIQNFDGTKQSIENVKQSLDNFLESIITTGVQGESSLTKMLVEMGVSEKEAAEAVKELTASFEENGQASAAAKEKILALITGTDAAKQKMEGLASTSASLGQQLMAVASMATTALNVVNNFKGIIETWKAGDPVEAVEQGFARIIASAPSLIMSISRVQQVFGITAGAATLWMAGITAAMALISIGFEKYKEALKDAYNQSAEAQFKRMQKAAEEEKERLEELRTEAEGIKSAFDEYDSIVDILSKCTEGTQEWKDALTNVNSSVSELIRQYPELLTMEKDGEKALYKDNNGVLKVADWAREDLLRANETKQIQAEAALYRSNQAAREAEIQVKQEQFSEQALGQSSEYISKIGDELASTVSQVLTRRLDIGSDEKWRGKTLEDAENDVKEEFFIPNQDKNNYAFRTNNGFVETEQDLNRLIGDLSGFDSIEKQTEEIYERLKTGILTDLAPFEEDISDFAKRYNEAFIQGLDTADIESEFRTFLNDIFTNQENEFTLHDFNTGKDNEDIRFAITETFNDDIINGLLTNSDLMNTASDIVSLINDNIEATKNESDLIAQSIITNNADLLNIDNIDTLLANSGEIFSSMFGKSIDENVEILDNAQKKNSKVEFEDANELLQNYAYANDIAGQVEKILYDGSLFRFLDEEGKEIKTATSTQVAAYKIGAESVTEFTNALISNAENINNLRKNGTKIDNLAADYAESGGSFKRSTIKNLTGRDSDEEISAQDFFQKSLGISDEDFNAIISQYNNDLQQALEEGAFDEIAYTVGAQSAKNYYDGIIQGLSEQTSKAEEIKTVLIDKLSLDDKENDILLSGIDLLNVDQAENLSKIIDQLNIGPLGEKAGEDFSKGLSLALSQAETEEDMKKIFQAFSSADWSQGSSVLNDITSSLRLQGIELDITGAGWDKFADSIDKATLQFNTFGSVKENFSNTIETLQKVKEVGDTISEEDYQALIEVFPKLSNSFIQVDDDTRRLIKDLNGLNYDDIANALSSLTDAQSLYNDIAEQTGGILEESFTDENFEEALRDNSSALHELAVELWGDEEELEKVLEEGGDSLDLLKERIIEWYQAGDSGQFETSFLGEMLASLTTDSKKLREYFLNDAIDWSAFKKQSDYILNYKKKNGEALTQEDVGNSLISNMDLSEVEDVAAEAQQIMDDLSNLEIDWDNLGFEDLETILALFNDDVHLTIEGWTDFVTSINSTRLEAFDLTNFKNNLSEVAQVLSGNMNIGDTISANGFKELIDLIPDLKDSFIQIDDNTYQLAKDNLDLETSLTSVISTFENYQHIVNTLSKNLGNTDFKSVKEFLSTLNDKTEEEKIEALSNMVNSLAENLTDADKNILEDVLGIENFNEALNSTDLDTLQMLIACIQSFIALEGTDNYDITPLYSMIAATYDLNNIDVAIKDAITAGNKELQDALELRKEILEKTQEQKEIEDTLSKAKDKSTYFDDERKQFYRTAKTQADTYYDSKRDEEGNLNEEDAKAYAGILREVGQGIAEINIDAVKMGGNINTAIREIKNAFGGETIDPTNLKICTDLIVELISNAKNLTLDEKLARIKKELEELGIPLAYANKELSELILNDNNLTLDEKLAKIKEELGGNISNDLSSEIEKVIANESTSTYDGIQKVKEICGDNYVLQETAAWIDKILNNNSTNTFEKLSELFNLADELGINETAKAAASLYEKDISTSQDFNQIVANNNLQIQNAGNDVIRKSSEVDQAQNDLELHQNEGSTVADYYYSNLSEKQHEYNEALETSNSLIAAINQSYQDFANNLDGSNFDSLEDLQKTQQSLIDLGAEFSTSMLINDVIEYASQFDICKEAIEEYEDALSKGLDVTKEFNRIWELASANDIAQKYDLNANYITALIDSYKELNPELEDCIHIIIAMAQEQARFNAGIEDINSNGKNYVEVFKELRDYGEESVLANSKLNTTYEKMVKTVGNLLNVDAKFAKQMLKNTDLAEDFEKALGGDEDAIHDLNKAAQKLTLMKLGLDDTDFTNGMDAALDHINELPKDKEIELNVNAEGFDETVAHLIHQMAFAEEQIGGTITDLQNDLANADLNVEFELVTPEQAADLIAQGEQIVAIAGDTADAMYSAMEGGTEAEITTETTETQDEVEAPPDQIATISQVRGVISSMSGGGGSAGEGGTGMIPVTVTNLPVTFPSVQYNANKEASETVEKADSVNLYHVKKATPGNAGKASHSNNTNRGGTGGCFTSETLISTNEGYKKIKNIKKGDIVLSYNLETNKNEYSKVLQTMTHNITGEIYSIYIDGDIIESTGIHKFLIIRGKKIDWIAAQNLKVSDLVYFADGTLHKIEMIKVKIKTLTVYNFEVNKNHNYYVGKNQILAHNKGGCFIAGTLVMAKNGYKNIENIQKGDIVLSFNEKYNRNEFSEVLETMIHIVNENIYTLYIEDEKLITTGVHKFLITRNGIRGWICASDLLIGDLVLFSDGTLHKIYKIDVNIEIRTVYNFEVNKNHNYYVGKNQILAHNKSRGGSGGGRGPSTTSTTKGVGEHKNEKERYHVVTKTLESLGDKYKDISSLKDRAFGKKHVKAINEEIKVLEKERETLEKYKKEASNYLKIDLKNLNTARKKDKDKKSRKDAEYVATTAEVTKGDDNEYKITYKESHKTAGASIKDVLGKKKYGVKAIKGAKIDENGNITNIDAIKGNLQKRLNKFNDKYAKNYKDKLDRKDFESDEEFEKAVQNNVALDNEKAKLEAQSEALLAYLDQYEETLAIKRQKITEEIEKEVEIIQTKLESTSYQVEIKLEVDDSAISILESKINNMGDKARTAVARIKELGKIMTTIGGQNNTTSKIATSEFGFSDTLSTIALNEYQKTRKDNSGTVQHFNDDNLQYKSQFLNGDEILKDFKENGANSTYISTLIGNNIIQENSKILENLNKYAQDELGYVQDIKSYRQQIMEIMQSTAEEYLDDLDNIISKQEHLNNLINGYYNVVNLIGRNRFYQDNNKGRELEANMDKSLIKAANQSLANIKKEKESIEKLIGSKEDTNSLTGKRENAQAEADRLGIEMKKALKAKDQKKADELKQSREEWLQQVDFYDNTLNQMHEKLRETEENEQAAFENALQTNLDAYQRALERAGEVFSETMSRTAGDFDFLNQSMDMQKKINEQTVASYEKAYQLRQMQLEAEKSIEKATDPKIKRELLAIEQEIANRAVDQKAATEYELKFLKQKLELKQAEAALEEAQKAKNQVSLTRDSEGNFGYVYTADDSAVADAEKKYSDKIYEMQKTNQEYIAQLDQELSQLAAEYQQAIMEVQSNTTLTDAERDRRIQLINNQYNALNSSLVEQQTNAFNASQDIFGQYSNNYAAITGDLMATNLEHIESFEQTVYAVTAGYSSMKDYTDTWATATKTLIGESKQAWADYVANEKTTIKTHGETVGQGATALQGYAQTILTETGNLVQALGNGTEDEPGLSKQLDETAATAESTFGAVLDAVKDIEEEFVGYLGQMETAANNLATAINEVLEKLSALESQAKVLDDVNKNSSKDKKSRVNIGSYKKVKGKDKNGDRKTKSTGSKKKKITYTGSKKSQKKLNKINTAAAKAVLGNKSALKKAEKDYKKSHNLKKLTKSQKNKAYKAAAKTQVKKLLNNYKRVTVHYDTGGYTGDWNGTDGKMAMLHKKELILNQQDTQNVLSAVGMIRDISNKIDLNALASSGAFSKIGSAGIGNLNNELEQHVQIEANFPNATSREEIQAAFENLIGLASQYANR